MERCAPGYLESQVTKRGQTRGREYVQDRSLLRRMRPVLRKTLDRRCHTREGRHKLCSRGCDTRRSRCSRVLALVRSTCMATLRKNAGTCSACSNHHASAQLSKGVARRFSIATMGDP
jgi:hypothetical protein